MPLRRVWVKPRFAAGNMRKPAHHVRWRHPDQQCRRRYAGGTGIGSRFDHVAAFNRDAVLTLRGRLAWAHDWVSNPSLAAVPGTNFIVNGATPAKDSALASAGAELKLVNGVTLSGKFDGEFARGSSTYAGTGTLRVSW